MQPIQPSQSHLLLMLRMLPKRSGRLSCRQSHIHGHEITFGTVAPAADALGGAAEGGPLELQAIAHLWMHLVLTSKSHLLLLLPWTVPTRSG